MNKKFDVVFSNPPYNNGLDLTILKSIKTLFKHAIIVHPSTWILENKYTSHFKKFKELFRKNIKSITNFNGSNVFNVPFMTPLCITYFDNEKNSDEIFVDDKISNSKYIASSYFDITQFGDCWFKFHIKEFSENLKKYKSIMDVDNRFPHFQHPDKVKFPIILTEFRMGNPHFNDVHYDQNLGYAVLNKGNTFFTCIAKGDKHKYHYYFDNKHVVLAYNFNTSEEREHFYNYCKTKVFRFILSIRKINAHNNSNELANTPWLDFTQEWNDVKLCKEFEISEELWNYINNFIPDYYDDYKSGKI